MGLNKTLTAMQTLFAFHGRIGRLRFIGYNCLVGVILIPVLLFSLSMIDGKTFEGGRVAVPSLPWLLMIWPGVALLVKRLHDMEWSGLHGIWICAIWYAPSSAMPDALASVVSFVAVAASLWLLLMPGTDGPNFYGLKAGMTIDRSPIVAAEPA